MHSLQPLLAFAETAKHGGFAAAARELGSAPSTLAKAVARLEATLGLRLFHRTTRQVSLTTDGERLFMRCQRVLEALDALQTEASSTRAAVAGTLRIDMPIVYGRKVVLPTLAALMTSHPALEIDARFSDGHVDLVRDGIDVAIRIGELGDSSLVARRIGGQDVVLVGAPAYLHAHGTPATLRDLDAHTHVVFRMPGRGHDRPQQFAVRGRLVTRTPRHRMRVDDGDALVQAAVLGLGLAQVPHYMAEDDIAAGRLVELLPALRPPTMPIHAVMPGHRMIPARVRVLFDAFAARGTPAHGAPRTPAAASSRGTSRRTTGTPARPPRPRRTD